MNLVVEVFTLKRIYFIYNYVSVVDSSVLNNVSSIHDGQKNFLWCMRSTQNNEKMEYKILGEDILNAKGKDGGSNLRLL